MSLEHKAMPVENRNAPVVPPLNNPRLLKPILRIGADVDFASLTPEAKGELARSVGITKRGEQITLADFDHRTIASETQAFIFGERVQALHDGMELFAECGELNFKADKTKANFLVALRDKQAEVKNALAARCQNNSSEDRASAQRILVEYRDWLRSKVREFFIVPADSNDDDSIDKRIDRAEKFANIRNGRPALCTITKSAPSEQKNAPVYQIQSELPQSPLSEEMKTQYLYVAQYLFSVEKKIGGDDSLEKRVNQYAWFKKLKPLERKLLWNVLRNPDGTPPATREQIAKRMQTIPSELRIIPGVPNHSIHRLITIDASGEAEEISSVLRSSMVSSRDLLGFSNAANRAEHTLHNAEHIIRNGIENILAANVSRLKREGVVNNGDRITLPFLMQTLISPLTLAWAGGLGTPDAVLFADKQAVLEFIRKNFAGKTLTIDGIRVNLEIIDTNHPQNAGGRGIDPTLPNGENGQQGLRLTAMALEHVHRLREVNYEAERARETHPGNPDAKELKREADAKALESAANQLQHLINNRPLLDNWLALDTFRAIGTTFGVPMADNRELHLAALEHITTQLMGGVNYDSCVSGKDRKGLELMYTDSMMLYHRTYGEWPQYQESDPVKKKRFTDIFSDLYCTRHQQNNAAQNARGCCGIKTPTDYLPRYLSEAVNQRMHSLSLGTLNDENLRASNNKVKKIKIKKSNWKTKGKTFGKAILAAIGGFVAGVWNIVITRPVTWFQRVAGSVTDYNDHVTDAMSRLDDQRDRRQAVRDRSAKRSSDNIARVHNSAVDAVRGLDMNAVNLAPSPSSSSSSASASASVRGSSPTVTTTPTPPNSPLSVRRDTPPSDDKESDGHTLHR